MGFARKLFRSQYAVSVTITGAVFLAVAAIRSTGGLESLELGIYDSRIRARPRLVPVDNPIALIKIREHEIQKYGHPLCDARLASALAMLQRLEPRAIGVDIYRDVPIHACSGPMGNRGLPAGDTDLAEVVLRDDRIVMIEQPQGDPPIRPPEFLAGSAQIAIPDLHPDTTGILRRGLLYSSHEDATYYALSFMLAYRYLLEEDLGVVNDPDRPELLRFGETAIPMFLPNEGGYHDADAGGYQYLLDFEVDHEGFPSYTLEDLYAESIPKEALQGKVVILGTESATVKDEFYSPLSAGLPDNPFLLGMEAHAHATLQLIRTARGETIPITSWEQRTEYAWILLWCVLGGALGCWKRSGWHTTAATAIGLTILVLSARFAFQSALWIPLVPPLLAAVIAAGLVTGYRAVMERTERRELTGLFSRFLRPEIAQLVWEQREQFMGPDGRPRAQSIMLTSLMSDLQGYTTASESMSPEALMTWVNEYMNTMANLVADFHGNVDDYAGDGIKANFGFPIPSSTEEAVAEDARNAVRCALAMGEAMDRLNEGWHQRNLPTGRTRIGIFTGPAVMGFLGGGKSLKWTTVGDTINTAARLEGFAKDEFSAEEGSASWRLLIGEGTLNHLCEAFHTEDLGHHVLKGKQETVRIFRVLGPSIRGDSPPEAATRKETGS